MHTEPSEDQCDAPLGKGDLVGRWIVGDVLGRGASATVYSALHTDLGRGAALKVLHHGAAFSADARARFLREGRAAAAVTHPHAVTVYDVAIHQGVPYLVMEHVAGETLATLLRREGVLSVSRAVELLLPIADALGAAHEAGIVHRDVKPANIAIVREEERERPVLLDFGAARLLLEADGDLTRSRAVLGTPAYMAPEQALAARAATPSCDQFSLAAVLLEATSGALPYAGSRWTECFAAAVRGEVQAVAKVAPRLPAGLARVLSRALAPDPRARFASMREFARALTTHDGRARRARWPMLGVAAVLGLVGAAAGARAPRARAQVTAGLASPSPPPRPVVGGDPDRLLRSESALHPAPAAPEPARGDRGGSPIARPPRARPPRRRALARAVVDAGAAPAVVELGPNDAPILAH